MTAHLNHWYKNGLRFQCNRCGNCCRGDPGAIWVNEKEIRDISDHLKMPLNKFGKRFLRKIGPRHSLIELDNGDCVMYEWGCKIYPVRPRQCISFPFWRANLETRDAWESLRGICPGIDKGRLYTFDKIRKIIELR